MCKRISITTELSSLSSQFRIQEVGFSYTPCATVEPTQELPVVVRHHQERRLEQFRWGLVPFWAKDAVYADSDLVHEKPAYRRMFAKRRCIIPCNGYEVVKREGKKQTPLRVALKEQGTFGIAGLYEIWLDSRGGEYRTCTVMTTRPNRLVHEYEEYMPVILGQDEMEEWLDDSRRDPDYLQDLLKPYDPDQMEVSTI